MKKSIFAILYSFVTFRDTLLSWVTYLTYLLHEFYLSCLYVAMHLYGFIYLFIHYFFKITVWTFEFVSSVVKWFSPVDTVPFGTDSDLKMCSDLTDDLINTAVLIHSTFVASLTRFCWFLSFVVPFSFVVNASATNEYLLFCSILLTLFFFYDKLVDLVSSSLAPSTQVLHTLVTNKLAIVSEISSYQEDMISSYEQVASLFEELMVLIAPIATETQIADFSLFDESLSESLKHSLRDQLFEEYTLSFYFEFFEELEFSVEALEILLEDFEEKFV